MKQLFVRLGRMVTNPVAQTDRLLRSEEGDAFESLWVFIIVVAGLNFLTLYQATLFFEQRPFWVIQKLFSLVAFHGQSIFLFLAVWVILFFGAARLLLKQALPVGRLFHGTSYLLNLFSMVLALGGIFAFAGFDHWALPHHPVHSALIWSQGQIMWSRYAVKCALTYGLPVIIGLRILWNWRKNAENPDLETSARWGVAGGCLLIVVLWVGSLGHAYGKLDVFKPVLVGDTFPNQSLPFLQARASDPMGKYDFNETGEKLRVIDFWASWCGPCLKGLPQLEKIAKDYKNRGVMVIGVNREPTDLPAAKSVLEAMSPDFLSVVDSGKLARAVGVQVLPTTFVVLPSGRVTFVHMGALDEADLRAAIERGLDDLHR